MDNDCVCDALLADVVSKAKAARQAIRSQYDDPEEAWLDGYIEGWFAGHFKRTPEASSEPITEPMTVL